MLCMDAIGIFAHVNKRAAEDAKERLVEIARVGHRVRRKEDGGIRERGKNRTHETKEQNELTWTEKKEF